MDQMRKRDEFVRQVRETCAYFEDAITGTNNIPDVPMSPPKKRKTPADLAAGWGETV